LSIVPFPVAERSRQTVRAPEALGVVLADGAIGAVVAKLGHLLFVVNAAAHAQLRDVAIEHEALAPIVILGYDLVAVAPELAYPARVDGVLRSGIGRAVVALQVAGAALSVGQVREELLVHAVLGMREVGPVHAVPFEELRPAFFKAIYGVRVHVRPVVHHVVARAAPVILIPIPVVIVHPGAVRTLSVGIAPGGSGVGRRRLQRVFRIEHARVVDLVVIVVAFPRAVGFVGARSHIVCVRWEIGASDFADTAWPAVHPTVASCVSWQVAALIFGPRARKYVHLFAFVIPQDKPRTIAAYLVCNVIAGHRVPCFDESRVVIGTRLSPRQVDHRDRRQVDSGGLGCGGRWSCGGGRWGGGPVVGAEILQREGVFCASYSDIQWACAAIGGPVHVRIRIQRAGLASRKAIAVGARKAGRYACGVG